MSSNAPDRRSAPRGRPAPARGQVPGQVREATYRFHRIGSHRLRVATWPGEAGRVPLLMFNGIGASLELLTPLADALEGVEIIAFDAPGVGESSAPRFPYRLWMLARVVSRLLDDLGVERVDVMGVSWGGTLAQQFALQHPHRCRRVVLAATAQGALMVPGRPAVLKHFITARRHNDPGQRRRIAGTIYGGRMREDPGLLAVLDQGVRPVSRYAYLLQQLAVTGWTSVPWLPLLRQPTLILAGSDDPVIPLVNARLMAALIRRSRLHVFDDGHLFILSQLDETAGLVREFLFEA